MKYENKISIVVLDDLENWQKLNVVSFLASAVAIKFPETHGASFTDRRGNVFMPFIKQPITVFKAIESDQLLNIYRKAKQRNIEIGIYNRMLFSTKNEEENKEIIARMEETDYDLVGIVLFGTNSQVDKSLKGIKLHS